MRINSSCPVSCSCVGMWNLIQDLNIFFNHCLLGKVVVVCHQIYWLVIFQPLFDQLLLYWSLSISEAFSGTCRGITWRRILDIVEHDNEKVRFCSSFYLHPWGLFSIVRTWFLQQVILICFHIFQPSSLLLVLVIYQSSRVPFFPFVLFSRTSTFSEVSPWSGWLTSMNPAEKEKWHQPVQGAIDVVQYAVPHTVVLKHESLGFE